MILPRERLEKLTKRHSMLLMIFGSIFGSFGSLAGEHIPTIIIVPIAIGQFILICLFGKKWKIETQIKLCCIVAAMGNIGGQMGITVRRFVFDEIQTNVSPFYLSNMMLGLVFVVILHFLYYEPKFILFQLVFANLDCIFCFFLIDVHFGYIPKDGYIIPWIILNITYIMIYFVSKMSSKQLIELQESEKESKQLNLDFKNKVSKSEKLVSKQKEMISTINQTSSDITSSSKELSQIVDSLSTGATSQSSSIENLTYSIQEITKKTRNNANSANELIKLTKEASNSIQIGKSHINDVTKAMNEIEDNSSKIYSIMDDLNDIAFLTNVLALNAVIETANAGDNATALTSVTKDIQLLAQKRNIVTEKTNDLIIAIVETSKKGTDIVNTTNITIDKIVRKNSRSSNIVKQIFNSSKLQVTNIEKISMGITRISDTTQQNAAASEETSAASNKLYSNAQKLNRLANASKL